ncbi:sigma-70 family RNA polymerase sigma factor [bacterium]|nr:sigma-70 family RNA polymerase sigma factor [bacterium]
MDAHKPHNPILRTLRLPAQGTMNIEATLIEACRMQDRKAQHELYKRCYSGLMGICLRYEKNREDAEALLNMAFFKILTRMDQYSDAIPFEAWAKRVTINTVIDEFRKKTRDKLDFVESFDYSMPLDSMDYNEAEQRYDAESLEALIRTLPPISQKVFNLYILDGYNHKEIGEMLSISEGTSKWHLSTARKTLQGLLRKLVDKVALF